MISQGPSLKNLVGVGHLQRMQDAFSRVFDVSTLVVDPAGEAVTEPSEWRRVAVPGESAETARVSHCRRVKNLLMMCREDGGPATSRCLRTGLFTAAVPIFLDRRLLGAWILDRLRMDDLVDSRTRSAMEQLVAMLRRTPVEVPPLTRFDFEQMCRLLRSAGEVIVRLGSGKRTASARERLIGNLRDQADAAKAMLRNLLDHSHVPTSIADCQTGELLMANAAYCRLVGATPEEVLGEKCRETQGGADDFFRPSGPPAEGPAGDGDTDGARTWVRFDIRSGLWFRVVGRVIPWAEGRKALLITQHDVTPEYRKHEELRRLAYIDAQTGAFNCHKLAEDIGPSSEEAADLICFDLSPLDLIRNAIGREVSRELLTVILDWFVKEGPGGGALYRIEGDRFCVLMRNAVRRDLDAEANRVAARFAKPWRIRRNGRDVPILCGVHVAVVSLPAGRLLDAGIPLVAARALDAARSKGRMIVHDERADRRLRERADIGASLLRCVDGGMLGFDVHYQPIVHLGSGTWHGLEALCRWTSPEFGEVPPARFISDAERLGLVGDVGMWVLENGVQTAKRLDLAARPDFFLSVNLSALQVMDDDFADGAADVLSRHGYPGDKISLDIAERTRLDFPGGTRSAAARLRDLGMRIALDDFASTDSSFDDFGNQPAELLKTGIEFARRIEGDSHLQHFLYTVSEIAHTRGMQLVAKGVETREQFEIIRRNGADFIQGNFFSQPLPEAELAAALHRFERRHEAFAGAGDGGTEAAGPDAGAIRLPTPGFFSLSGDFPQLPGAGDDADKAPPDAPALGGKARHNHG